MISTRSAHSKIAHRSFSFMGSALLMPILCAFLLPGVAQAQDAPDPAQVAANAPHGIQEDAPPAVETFSVSVKLSSETDVAGQAVLLLDRKSTRLNSSHVRISYAVFCLK